MSLISRFNKYTNKSVAATRRPTRQARGVLRGERRAERLAQLYSAKNYFRWSSRFDFGDAQVRRVFGRPDAGRGKILAHLRRSRFDSRKIGGLFAVSRQRLQVPSKNVHKTHISG
jgi:hypothetical protein